MKSFGIRAKLVLSYLAIGAAAVLASTLAARHLEFAVQRTNLERLHLLGRVETLSSLANATSEKVLSYAFVGEADEHDAAKGDLAALLVQTRQMGVLPGLSAREAALAAATVEALEAYGHRAEALLDAPASTAVHGAAYDAYEAAFDPLEDRISALGAEARVEGESEAASVRRDTDLLTGCIACVVLAVAWLLGNAMGWHITRPVLKLRDAVVAFGTGDTGRAFPGPSTGEVGVLTAAFHEMAHAIRAHIETIRRARQELDDVFESIDGMVLVCSAEGRVVHANPGAARLAKRPQERLIGLAAGELFAGTTPETRQDSIMPAAGECMVATPDGSKVPVRVSVSTLRGQAGRGWVLVAHDLTEQRRMESELRQAQKLEAIGRLAAGVAHEINTPVQFVGDNLQFVRDAVGDLLGLVEAHSRSLAHLPDGCAHLAIEAVAAEQRVDLAYVRENVPQALEASIEGLGRITAIVRSMKEFAHPSQHEVVSADLNKLLASTFVVARHEYRYVADVVTDFEPLPPVDCVPGELNQAFLNVLVNAAHAIGDVRGATGGKGTIAVRTRHDHDRVVVSFTDDGGGIPASVRDRIFDPFFTTKEVGRGTGQGLAIVRSIVVTKHGGSITVESEVGRGTTISLALPIARAAAAEEAA